MQKRGKAKIAKRIPDVGDKLEYLPGVAGSVDGKRYWVPCMVINREFDGESLVKFGVQLPATFLRGTRQLTMAEFKTRWRWPKKPTAAESRDDLASCKAQVPIPVIKNPETAESQVRDTKPKLEVGSKIELRRQDGTWYHATVSGLYDSCGGALNGLCIHSVPAEQATRYSVEGNSGTMPIASYNGIAWWRWPKVESTLKVDNKIEVEAAPKRLPQLGDQVEVQLCGAWVLGIVRCMKPGDLGLDAVECGNSRGLHYGFSSTEWRWPQAQPEQPATPPPPPEKTIPQFDHLKALFQLHAERAMDLAKPFWLISDIARGQADNTKEFCEELGRQLHAAETKRPFFNNRALELCEYDLTQAAKVVTKLQEMQQCLDNSVRKLDDFYFIDLAKENGPWAFKILREFYKEAQSKASWYTDAWNLILRAWETISPKVGTIARSNASTEYKLAT
jgi:hypothetical protein